MTACFHIQGVTCPTCAIYYPADKSTVTFTYTGTGAIVGSGDSMSTKPEAGSPDELAWLRGFEEARNHYLTEIKKLKVKISAFEEDSKMFLAEHDENVRLHFENVDLKEQNARLRGALEWMVNNQHLTIMIEEPEHVEHFMSRARDALEGKASE